MKNVYIVLFSCANGGDTLCREIEGVYLSKKNAAEKILSGIQEMLIYDEGPRGGKRMLCDNNSVILDEEATTHNGGVLTLSVPEEEFNHIRFYDDEVFPEWVREWDIEEHEVVGKEED